MEPEVEIKNKEEMEKEDKACCHGKMTKFEIACGILTGTLYLVAIIAYLLIGFLTGIWHPTWVVFLAPLVISSLVLAIGERKAQAFNYPVFVVMVYIVFSSLFALWHPLWVIFITIPIYYSVIKFAKELKK